MSYNHLVYEKRRLVVDVVTIHDVWAMGPVIRPIGIIKYISKELFISVQLNNILKHVEFMMYK